MKLAAIAAIATGAIALMGTVATFALPTQMHVHRSAVVDGSPAELTQMVAQFPKRQAWVAWTEIDPAAAYTYTGEPGHPGATMSWKGDEIGTATLQLERVDPGREVVSTLTYEAPFTMTSTDRFVFEDLGNGSTRVTWTAEAPLVSASDRLFGLVADQMLGPDYEWGLRRLQATFQES